MVSTLEVRENAVTFVSLYERFQERGFLTVCNCKCNIFFFALQCSIFCNSLFIAILDVSPIILYTVGKCFKSVQ